MNTLDERQLEREIQGIPDPKPKKRIGQTGYTIRGTFRIPVMRDPSRYYVRFPDGGFIKALHDGNASATDEMAVEVYQETNGEWHIRAPGGEESAAYEDELGGGMYLPSHTHVSTEVTDMLTYLFAYFLRLDGSNGMTGALDMNSNAIREISTIITGGTAPHTSAAIQSDSTTKGWLPPRLTTTQRDAISSPQAGLFIYNSTEDAHQFYNGSSWISLEAPVDYSIYAADDVTTVNPVSGFVYDGDYFDIIDFGSGNVFVTLIELLNTIGDLLYVNGAGDKAALPIGTSGQVLTVDAGVPAWKDATGGAATTRWEPLVFDNDIAFYDGDIVMVEVVI